MERPTGITILAIVAFITGGLHFLGSFLAFASGSWLSAGAKSGYFIPAAAPYVNSFGNLGFWIGLIGMLLAVVTLVAAAGLWTLARFGYWLTIVGVVLNLISDAVSLLSGYASVATLVAVLLCVGILWYMSRPHVRHAFDGFPIDAPTRQTT
jgi:hypothetical protein